MARFTGEQQRFIVIRLAQFEKPKEIVAALKAEYGVTVEHLSQISYYDPVNRASSEELASDLVDLFHATRNRFREDLESIPIASKAYRLRELTALLEHDLAGFPAVRMEILEQAAKEVGGLYQARVSPGDVEAFVGGIADKLSAEVDLHVTDPLERDRVKAAVKKFVEGTGGSEGG